MIPKTEKQLLKEILVGTIQILIKISIKTFMLMSFWNIVLVKLFDLNGLTFLQSVITIIFFEYIIEKIKYKES